MQIEETLAERGSKYGSSYLVQSSTAQALKVAMQNTPNWSNLSPDKRESLELIATKISRMLHGDSEYHDNWHDIIGYAKLVADTLKA